MGSQLNALEKNLCVYIVVPDSFISETECSEEVWEVYNKCIENVLKVEWIREGSCMDKDFEKTDIVVMEKFEGSLFEFLEKTNCVRVVGTKCFLRCFLIEESLPMVPSPIYSTAMKDLIICISGFTPEIKEGIKKKISYMGGVNIKDLRSCTTHLISDSVMSVKYEKATEMNLPVYSVKWVEAVWNKNLDGFVKAVDPIFDQYKSRVFMNLTVTTTNLLKVERDKLKKLIVDNGGEYTGPLDGSKVKILLAKKYSENSDKLKFAIRNNIPCLMVDWVFKSLEVGYALPFKDYVIEPNVKTSTPTRNETHFATLNCSEISNIPDDRNVINETASTISSLAIDSKNDQTINNDKLQYIDLLEKIDIANVKKAGPFLDGCNIYLAGFLSNYRDLINKILNIGNATRYNDISDSITHFLIGDPNKASNELKCLQSKGYNPHVVTFEWLTESIKMRKAAPEEPYLFGEKTTARKLTVETHKQPEPASPLSKKSLKMLQKIRRPPVPKFNLDRKSPEPDEEPEILQQYLRHNEPLTEPRRVEVDQSSNVVQTSNRSGNDNDTHNDSSQLTTIDKLIFEGMTFMITGFHTGDSSILNSKVTDLGGKIVSSSNPGIPDFGIVPFIFGQLKYTVKEVVTELFIEDCINNETLVDITSYHRPIFVPEEAKPLSDCVIVISSYLGIERNYLKNVITALGGRHEEKFARKTNVEKQQVAATHLICDMPSGNKYNAAIKWKIPVVYDKWLIACLQKLDYVSEEKFLVGESILSEDHISYKKLNNTTTIESSQPPAASSEAKSSSSGVKNMSGPSGSFDQLEEIKTPIINKRLNLNDSIQSPFHIKTPSSPLGQVFKDNPSPHTKKTWAKWLDTLPENKLTEKKLPEKRRNSTPMSEFKRKIWKGLVSDNSSGFSSLNNSTDDNHTPNNPNTSFHNESVRVVNRELSYTDDDHNNTNNFEIHEKLERMNKALQLSERRVSITGNNVNIYEEPKDKFQVQETQPDSVGWEDPKRRMTNKTQINPISQNTVEEKVKIRKFMLSKLTHRDAYESKIRQLGGEISTTSNYDPTATHLICIKPVRNEKMLSSIAAGKWVLHSSYIDDSSKKGEFIDEELYEWGNPKSKNVIPSLAMESDLEKSLGAAAYRWRIKLSNSGDVGAFENMVAMLIVPKDKYDQFFRFINAGGGTVVEAKPPYDVSLTGQKITHCFIQLNKIDHPIDWAMLASKGVLCFNPSFLNQFLVATGPINLRDFVIEEFKKYLTLLPKS